MSRPTPVTESGLTDYRIKQGILRYYAIPPAIRAQAISGQVVRGVDQLLAELTKEYDEHIKIAHSKNAKLDQRHYSAVCMEALVKAEHALRAVLGGAGAGGRPESRKRKAEHPQHRGAIVAKRLKELAFVPRAATPLGLVVPPSAPSGGGIVVRRRTATPRSGPQVSLSAKARMESQRQRDLSAARGLFEWEKYARAPTPMPSIMKATSQRADYVQPYAAYRPRRGADELLASYENRLGAKRRQMIRDPKRSSERAAGTQSLKSLKVSVPDRVLGFKRPRDVPVVRGRGVRVKHTKKNPMVHKKRRTDDIDVSYEAYMARNHEAYLAMQPDHGNLDEALLGRKVLPDFYDPEYMGE